MWNPNKNFKFTEDEFNAAKSHDKLPISCVRCGKKGMVRKARLKRIMEGKEPTAGQYCSKSCRAKDLTHETTRVTLTCCYCGEDFETIPSRAKGKKRQKYWFCSKFCRLNAAREMLLELHGRT